MFDSFKEQDSENKGYYYEGFKYINKLKNGQTLEVRFQKWDRRKQPTVIFFVIACVYTKRKHKDLNFANNKVTGGLGLSILLEIKLVIELFIQFIKEHAFYSDKVAYIEIVWPDNRRKKAYIRGLSSLGFQYCNDHDRACLKYYMSTSIND